MAGSFSCRRAPESEPARRNLRPPVWRISIVAASAESGCDPSVSCIDRRSRSYTAPVSEIDDLALVVAAAADANFRITAERHHVSQSTVSRAVARVEKAVGGAIFVRDGRRVTLAPKAAGLIDELRGIVDSWARLTAGPGTTPAPQLTVFCTVTASQSIVPGMLQSFRRTHGDVALHLRTGPASAAIDAVADGTVDAAIALLPERLPRPLVSLEIAPAPLIAVAAQHVHDWTSARILLPRAGLVHAAALRWCNTSLVRGTWTVEETDGHEEVVALAALGSGIGIVPQLVVM